MGMLLIFAALLLTQDSLYFGNGFGDGGVVATYTVLTALFCSDMVHGLCGIVMVQDPFELGEQFRGKGFIALPNHFFWVSTRGRELPDEGLCY